MNNRQGGRRRGRNNQRQPGGAPRGNGDSGNRIDSRARGNAAQLLEKYRNLAREAQLSGDRVQTEYYLQFADHYFRVLADARSRQEEQRAQRHDDRYDDRADVDDAPFGFGDEGEAGDPSDDMAEREPRREPRRRERSEWRGRDAQPRREDGDADPRRDQSDEAARPAYSANEGSESNSDEADRAQRRGRGRRRAEPQNDDAALGGAAIDLAVLPPAIGVAAASAGDGDTGEAAPAPRRRLRTRKAEVTDDRPSAD